MNLIGNNIRRLREERNMLQSELAEKVNVSPATVSSWEVGRTEPKIGKLKRFHWFCQVTFDKLRHEIRHEQDFNTKKCPRQP